MPPLRLLLLDFYDSYTHNLSHLIALANFGHPPTVIRADAYPTLHALHLAHAPFHAFILSPGPGTPLTPSDFPALPRAALAAGLPLLAVCLGHQALCHLHGARILPAPAGPVHGAVTPVLLAPAARRCPLLAGLPPVFRVVRYHSLVAAAPLPPALLPTAWATDRAPDGRHHTVLMAVRHASAPLFGLQFHPESVASQHGLRIAANFLAVVRAFHSLPSVPRPIAPPAPPPPPPPPPRPAHYRTLVRQIRDLSVDAPHVFVRLFSRRNGAFWLDSSSAAHLGSVVSRGSSPDLPPDSPHDPIPDHPPDRPKDVPAQPDTMRGRFSIMGACTGPLSEIVSYSVEHRHVSVTDSRGKSEVLHNTTIFDYLQSALAARYAPQHPDLPIEMNGGYVGYIGYEVKKDIEGVKRNHHQSDVPDAWFTFADRALILDHEEGSVYLVAVIRDKRKEDLSNATRWFEDLSDALESMISQDSDNGIGELFDGQPRHVASHQELQPLAFTPERSRSSYLEDIRKCLREINDGESYEICLTNRLRTVLPEKLNIDPVQIYCALRLVNPAPYAAFLRISDSVAVCCSSPERYLQINSTGTVTSKPIKGTLPRGRSLEEDDALRMVLQNSEKDRRENLMVVDLVRNDLSRTCVVGSVHVPQLMYVETYATVHQLVTTIRGVLTHPQDAMSCIRAAFPMGSMTGAPKVRTMEIIDGLEHSARGIYSGSIGFLSLCGAADLNVVIRTAIIKGKHVEIGVGGAITALSSPEVEYDEVIIKGKALMQALAMQTTGQSDSVVLHEHSRKSHETNVFGEEQTM